MRKKSMEEDLSILPTVSNSNRLSRFLPSCKFLWFFDPILKRHFAMFPVYHCMLFPFLQQSCIRNTAMLPSTGRSKGNKEKNQARRRKGSEMTGQMGPRLHPICPHPAPFAHHGALLLLCGRTSLMFEAVASWTTSAMRRGNYRRWWCRFRYGACGYVLSCTRLTYVVSFCLRQSLSWWLPRHPTSVVWQLQWTISCCLKNWQNVLEVRTSIGSSLSSLKSKTSARGEAICRRHAPISLQ